MKTASQTIELVLPSLHPAQQQIIDEARRFNVLACGRRFGKTMLGIDLIIDKVLDGYPVSWFSPTYKMLAEVWKEIVETTKQLQTRVAKQEHRIELITAAIGSFRFGPSGSASVKPPGVAGSAHKIESSG